MQQLHQLCVGIILVGRLVLFLWFTFKIYQHIVDRLPWNFVQTFMLSRMSPESCHWADQITYLLEYIYINLSQYFCRKAPYLPNTLMCDVRQGFPGFHLAPPSGETLVTTGGTNSNSCTLLSLVILFCHRLITLFCSLFFSRWLQYVI